MLNGTMTFILTLNLMCHSQSYSRRCKGEHLGYPVQINPPYWYTVPAFRWYVSCRSNCPGARSLSVELPPITGCAVWHYVMHSIVIPDLALLFCLDPCLLFIFGDQIPNERTEQTPRQQSTSIPVFVLSSSYPSIQS
jgi:hypothetical protein